MADLLLVDDDPDISEPLVEILQADGHRVRVAENGEVGLRLLAEAIPDLVLLDVEMPVLGGPDMANQMFLEDVGREQVPIVFLSGVPDLHRIADLVGTAYYLQKPFQLDALRKVVARALAERTAPTYSEWRRIHSP
ncbi:MAG TPA: response regulator [Kofleriaceae bacterium]|jgi:DNA-binding response OmpR family regulator|nr:response regulator [Kofleriaceae bacterium]